jgi:hypothetical protein
MQVANSLCWFCGDGAQIRSYTNSILILFYHQRLATFTKLNILNGNLTFIMILKKILELIHKYSKQCGSGLDGRDVMIDLGQRWSQG